MSRKRHHHERESQAAGFERNEPSSKPWLGVSPSIRRRSRRTTATALPISWSAVTTSTSHSYVRRAAYPRPGRRPSRSGGMRSRRVMCSRRPRDAVPAGNERRCRRRRPASGVATRTRTRIRGSCSPRSARRSNQSCCQPGTVPPAGTSVMLGVLYSSITAARTTCSPSRGISIRRG